MPTRTEIRTATRVRREFIDFFVERHGHAFVPSSPVVPRNDPTLLFANAGMNQFKDVFLGQGRRDYARAVNSQKCIRAGGKHNDLEDVGRDHYHHTFFEMLGNWSFGDYFKEEAIEWAWALLTEVWGLEAERLQITVFAGDEADGLPADEEAASIWRKYVPEDRISRWGRKDNFWEMGGTGPCGPCSEIHYDFTPDRSGAPLVNLDDPRVVELWNLVFIQFNRGEEGGLTPLPARHVDTGMGLERLTRVLQHKESNYDTDLWTPVFAAIEAHTGAHPYRGRLEDPVDVAYRVVADHVRCLTVALADGAVPGNEGRGYVLRRILRRAVRHAHQTLGVEGPVLCDLTRAVVDSLGDAFPDLGRHLEHVTALIRDEERSFLRTLDRGLALFDEAVEQCRAAGSSRISAESAFRLHDTFGFPFDLTRVMARERGLDVDEAGYEARMTEARAISRRGGDERRSIDLPADAIARLRYKGVEPTVDVEKHDGRPITAHVKAVWNGTDFDEDALDFGKSDLVGLVTDRTNFYAEQGGQVGDTGVVRDVDGDRSELQVVDTRVYDGYVLHVGRLVRGRISVGESLELVVDRSRRGCIRANHTATHLLNHALREVLGDDVDQKGSLVAADRLRFDFSFSHAMDDEQLRATEALVNEWIAADLPVHAEEVPLDVARALHGVRAVFGEHYPDPVRVVSIGTPVSDLVAAPDDPRWRGTSIEFCGGTHLARTKEAERFVLVHEQALAAGVRRITALTAAAAVAANEAAAGLARRIEEAAALDDERLPDEFDDIARQVEALTLAAPERRRLEAGLDGLRARARDLRRQHRRSARDGVVAEARRIATDETGPVIVGQVGGADKDGLLAALDVVTGRHDDAAVMLFTTDEEASRVVIVAAVPAGIIRRGLKAGDWVKHAASVCDGSGGGRPERAQAGGKNPARVGEAISAARRYAEQVIL